MAATELIVTPETEGKDLKFEDAYKIAINFNSASDAEKSLYYKWWLWRVQNMDTTWTRFRKKDGPAYYFCSYGEIDGETRFITITEETLRFNIGESYTDDVLTNIIMYGKEEDINAKVDGKAKVIKNKRTTEETKELLTANKTPTENDTVQIKPDPIDTSQDVSKEFEGSEYINKYLGPLFNDLCRSDTLTPQIPPSIPISISLARTGMNSQSIGQFNFWRLPYDQTYTTLENDDGYCAFESKEEGAKIVLKLLHDTSMASAIALLKTDLRDTPDKDKETVTSNICQLIDQDTGGALFSKAMEYVNTYKLRNWDSEEYKEKTTIDSNEESAIAKFLKKTITSSVKQRFALGTRSIPVGKDYVMIIKLVPGLTIPAEPVYPDLVTVSDTIPEWIYTQPAAEAAENAKNAKLAAAGIETDTKVNLIAQFNQDFQSFKDGQFALWIQTNGISYSNENEKATAVTQYNTAASTNTNGEFTDGIYLPDSESKQKYQNYLKKKRSLLEQLGTATDVAYSQYQDSARSVAEQIAAAEQGWNQETGSSFDPSKYNYDLSSIAGGVAGAENPNSANIKSVQVLGPVDNAGVTGTGAPGSGQGKYWAPQSSVVSWSGARPETLKAMDMLGQWFYNKTGGYPLSITAVTNGSHASGTYSHGAGWKFDCNDWGGGSKPGTLTTDSFGKGTLLTAFLNYGRSIGLGMNWEAPGTFNVHIDVSAHGDQWADDDGQALPTPVNYGGIQV